MLSIEKIIQFEMDKKIWDRKFKNIPVWSYLRGSFFSQYLPYKYKMKISLSDVIGLLKFFSLFFLKKRIIVFVSGRKDLINYSYEVVQYYNMKSIYFIRDEGDIKGNVFFLEVFRFFCRKFLWVFFYSEKKYLVNYFIENEPEVNTNPIKDLIGDYIFYKIIKWILKRHDVIYSNCVIPRVARYLKDFNTIEIQHGVIHVNHLDYVYVPYIKSKFVCFSNSINVSLKEWHYSGLVEVIEKKPKIVDISYNIVFFTTVDKHYSLSIQKIIKMFPVCNYFKFKKHPRDNFNYDMEINNNIINNISPVEVRFPVLPDTSMISDCFLNNKEFIYYSLGGDKSQVREYLLNKYNIYGNPSKFYIFTSENELYDFLYLNLEF